MGCPALCAPVGGQPARGASGATRGYPALLRPSLCSPGEGCTVPCRRALPVSGPGACARAGPRARAGPSPSPRARPRPDRVCCALGQRGEQQMGGA